MHIAFFGSSLLSSYWNGAATYYRGIISALARRGCSVTFYEPDAFDRQQHRDIDAPDWAESVVFPATAAAMQQAFRRALDADVIVKASGIGVLDNEILAATASVAGGRAVTVFWDVDAPATLAEIASQPQHLLRSALRKLDCVLTYGGGAPVVDAYRRLGARQCVPIYNALDPCTHFPVARDQRFAADLAFLGNRLPDREARVEAFFFDAARQLPDRTFLLAGAGWEPSSLPPNIKYIGHLPTHLHNAFNSSPLAVINISRQSMAATGFSPATRVFEAAGAGACIITDGWEGIENFLTPEREVLVAHEPEDVVRILSSLIETRAHEIGIRARARVLSEHTYTQRAEIVEQVLRELIQVRKVRVPA